MATTGVGFRWLDILEKEFDKACVELDTSLSELETEEPEVVFGARQKIATLSSCFAQLTHKALTIFQNSAKLEAELVDMRAELVQARAASAGGLQDAGDAAGNVPDAARARAEAAQLARENAALRETVLALHSELFGARLATKYLDKELAGRIQQLQLLGRDMRAELRDSLWAQVEAEILLQRHKTLVRVCRGLSPRPPRPAAPPPARPRTVRVKRPPHLGLGISVTGGREHGVPILISELEAGGPAALTGELYVGDAILAINDLDLTQACHKEAVQALQSVKGDCALCVQFIATDDDDRLSEDNYRFPLYPEDGSVFAPEPDGEGATPTAPRTPDYNNRVESEAGSVSSLEEGATAATGGHYPDYNSINNNLAILDMDDHCIKIQTQIEQVAPLESAPGSPRPLRGVYRPLPAESSADSVSTPVHTRRQTLKKKRKPDWRTKGAYRAVDDLHSSDDNQALETQECSPPLTEGAGRASTAALSSTAHDNGKGGSDGQLSARRESKAFRIGSAQRVTGHPATALQNQIDQGQQTHGTQNSHEPQNSNGAQNSNGPQNSHGPQISYGPPNSHGPRIPEGPQVPHVPLTNGDVVDKCKLRARLLAGDGDPDFGTPV